MSTRRPLTATCAVAPRFGRRSGAAAAGAWTRWRGDRRGTVEERPRRGCPLYEPHKHARHLADEQCPGAASRSEGLSSTSAAAASEDEPGRAALEAVIP